tara:strand:- start:1472 stop:1597 length:126 start_codon:yes stop_codon:yes gene_type:complete
MAITNRVVYRKIKALLRCDKIAVFVLFYAFRVIENYSARAL